MLDNILLSKEPGAEPIFPSLVSLPKEENLQDTESTIQVSPAWIFSDISEKDFIHLQDIITLRSDKLLSDIKSLSLFNTSTSIDNSSFSLKQLTPSSITQLISFPKIWMALFTCVIQLPEANIEWRTIQSLQSVLRKAQWFYFYGLYTSQSTNTSAENISSYLIDWNDFVKLQMVDFKFLLFPTYSF